MTEAEWLNCTDPAAMLQFLRGRVSERKLRLFACACCRKVWSSLTAERCRRAVETAERFADGSCSVPDLRKAWSLARDAAHRLSQRVTRGRLVLRAGVTTEEGRLFFSAETVHAHMPFLIGRLGWVQEDTELRSAAPYLLREMVGVLPFRPVMLPAAVLAWNDAVVPRLAQAAYDERHLPEGTLDAGRLAVLADALEEAGCTDADILGHLRGPGPHVRGCWVVDLVLGKS